MKPIHVKICGLTNLDDARVAVEAGADLLGFILYPKSPRYVRPEVVTEIISEIRDWRLGIGDQIGRTSLPISNPQSPIPKFVGVFVNEPVEQVYDILNHTGLDYAQLHGNETPDMLAYLQGRAFKALRPTSSEESLAAALHFTPLAPTAGPSLMLDAYDPKAYGGTGKTTDWQAAAVVAQRYPGLLLAGGLTPENVAEAIRTVHPWGVDVSSGVEAAPGWKDHAKVRAFIERARL